ncbi:MAG TPA: methyltransferase domain-containing protein [Thermoanaerobaculia bacterium]|nr:methyltransferase domain-containing protein [Thermoanaerobaculia bacterium]
MPALPPVRPPPIPRYPHPMARIRIGSKPPRFPGIQGPALDTLRRYALGEISAPVALASLLFTAGDAAEVESLLFRLADTHPAVSELWELLRSHPEGVRRIVPLLRDHPEQEAAGEAGIETCRRFFDRAVVRCEEASVALYCLGDPAILAEGTREVVELFARWGLLDPDHATLEIGSGIGRFQVALAGRVREAWGIDISEQMVAAATRRAAGLPNVHFTLGSGRDLAPFPDRAFDLVFAVDSFPYLQQAGPDFVAGYFAETARVLKPGGDFAVLNYSYTGDLNDDIAGFSGLCERFGFVVEVAGLQQLALWDGTAFLARRKR